jgi:hypothetical protein
MVASPWIVMELCKPSNDRVHCHDWRNDRTGRSDFPIASSIPGNPYFRDPDESHCFTCRQCGYRVGFLVQGKNPEQGYLV